ncbi:hypothetical protein [Dongia sp.]|uniref:hypothetical protein n=1 Tax=Dongia sp. TaxID=1977262 RepID=UPI0035AF233A
MTRIRSSAARHFAIGIAMTEAADRLSDADTPALRADVAALICPDWRVASLLIDARSGQVTYANTPCLQMLSDRSTIQITSGRLAFISPHLTDKFYVTLDRMLASGLENAAMVEREPADDGVLSVMIRNTQGFFRDVLNRSIGRSDEGSQLVVVELATSRDQSDWSAMRAFAQAFGLNSSEVEIADLIVRGLAVEEIAALKKRDPADILAGLDGLLFKTRCKHQVQLVRLIMTLCPPTRRA